MQLKILASLSMIAVASAAVGYGTYAAFSDTETSTGNIFTVGDLDLTLDAAQGVTGTVSAANFAPGDAVAGAIVLRNEGSILNGDAAGHVVTLSISVASEVTDDAGNRADPDDGGDSTAAPLDSWLIVTSLTYDGTNLLPTQERPVTLADLTAMSFTGLADPGSTGKSFAIGLSFDPIAPNHLKRDVADLTFTFALTQVVE